MIESGAQFENGRVSGFGADSQRSPESRPVANVPDSLLCDLNHFGVLRISGDDAAAFLHAQFTNDVMALEVGAVQLNAWCSPKGRLLVTVNLWRRQDGYYMLMPTALMAAIHKRLKMFVLRSRVLIEDVSSESVRMGVVGAGLAPQTPSPIPFVEQISLSSRRTLLIAPPAAAVTLWTQLSAASSPVGSDAWDAAQIREGLITVLPPTQDQFVPQMANFELVGGVSFKKGCYPGQEIVARTQYRGILKRRMARAKVPEGYNVEVGSAVYSPEFGDQVVGMVAMIAPVDGASSESLVVAQQSCIDSDALFLTPTCESASRLTRLTLPYMVPAADAAKATLGGQTS
jgi:folate-binding protein YgfZ